MCGDITYRKALHGTLNSRHTQVIFIINGSHGPSLDSTFTTVFSLLISRLSGSLMHHACNVSFLFSLPFLWCMAIVMFWICLPTCLSFSSLPIVLAMLMAVAITLYHHNLSLHIHIQGNRKVTYTYTRQPSKIPDTDSLKTSPALPTAHSPLTVVPTVLLHIAYNASHTYIDSQPTYSLLG